jgi:hypothetical protein
MTVASKASFFVLAALAALALSAASLGAVRTTAPSKRVTILVQITDKGLKFTKFLGSADAAKAELEVMPGPVPRGDYLSINVMNMGRKPHNFTILGKKTPWIKPGKTAHLFVTAVRRGNFPYRSTLDKGAAFRGQITIF